ncbi:peptidyl-prolyl cis-trans isomerase [Paenibacillus sp. BSR1-1]|uniref:peptidyl-prolyl cis-trans isomerase n=1 Tax=Paenibacillus sp. BSR1-1 TaxID=3020845 RepID=UPI0025AF784C|nr:peptidyl-prolyl cis-trans isomerase [Paenibacillus sp. BSR1-1]MDN3014897.1 peptidyl-prolyl cis-trans isomerase [Paenibacillus sp. BSR1-1]
MENIMMITGKVKYTITLDPGVWIFDDRRVDLTTYFSKEKENVNAMEEYTKAVSKHWDREITEGAIYPPTLKTEKNFEKVKVMNGTFGIPFKPFLKNAEPTDDASTLVVQCSNKDYEFPLDEAYELILGFSNNGKPLSLDGPVHVYMGNGSNQEKPIKNVTGFKLK